MYRIVLQHAFTGNPNLVFKTIKLGMKNTLIQWSHSTVNPVMGCPGCELWPRPGQIISKMVASAVSSGSSEPHAREIINARLQGLDLSTICRQQRDLFPSLASDLGGSPMLIKIFQQILEKAAVCYAARQHLVRAGRPGFADEFETPKLVFGLLDSSEQALKKDI